MRSSTGRWVGGDDFFDRESELKVLEKLVRQHNHVLLTGQRRMGKTSVARELGRRLEADGWIFLFADVEGASCPEDAIAEIAQAAYPIRPARSRFVTTMGRWFSDKVQEVGAHSYRVKIRAGLNPGSWRRYGERLLGDCGTGSPGSPCPRRAADISEADAGGRQDPTTCRPIPELDARSPSHPRRVFPCPRRVGQHRASAPSEQARNIGPHQPSLYVSLRALGSQYQHPVL